MKLYQSIFTAAMTLVFLAACAEKKEGVKVPTPAPATGNAKPVVKKQDGGGAVQDLCTTVKTLDVVKSNVPELANDFCLDVEELRTEKYVYTGGADPKIFQTNKSLSDQKTEMKLYTSMVARSDAKSYYNMMRLESMYPSDFAAAGFQSAPKAKSTVKSKTSDSADITYYNENQSPGDAVPLVVNYDQAVKFATIEDGKTYVVVSYMTKSIQNMVEFKGLVVINELSDGQSIEVFTLSDQTFQNNGQHEATMNKATSNLRQEQIRSYSNSLIATKANAKFP